MSIREDSKYALMVLDVLGFDPNVRINRLERENNELKENLSNTQSSNRELEERVRQKNLKIQQLEDQLSKALSDAGWQAEYQRQQDEFDQTGRYL